MDDTAIKQWLREAVVSLETSANYPDCASKVEIKITVVYHNMIIKLTKETFGEDGF